MASAVIYYVPLRDSDGFVGYTKQLLVRWFTWIQYTGLQFEMLAKGYLVVFLIYKVKSLFRPKTFESQPFN